MAGLVSKALTGLGVAGEIAGPLGSILFTGLSIALSIIFAPKVPKPEAGKIPFRQSVPPRLRIIGQRRTAGAFMLYHATPDGTFFGVNALCEGPANAITRMYLHEDVVQYQSDDSNTIGSVGEGRYGDGKVQIYTRLGVNPETAYPEAVSVLDPDADGSGIWTDNHRGDGICSALLVAADAGPDNQGQRFPGGVPVLSMVVDATQLYDPREDADQDWSDPSTWTGAGNDNPILQAMWFLTAPISAGGMGLDFEECFVPVLGDIKAQANICDELVPLKAGSPRKRYRSGALYQFSDDPSEVLAAILGTCDGFCAENGDGTFTLKAGKWDDDDFSVVLTDKHIISLNLQIFRPDEDEVTGVIVKYTSVDHEYTTIDAPVWPRDAYQGGEDRRVRPIEVTYCVDGYQAQRLAKRVATYEMAVLSGSAILKMYGILLLNKRGATLQCTDHPDLADCKIRLTRVEPNLVNGTVEIDFQVFDPDECDAWDPSTEEGPLQPIVTVPADKAFSTPAGLNASASQIAAAIIVDIAFDPGTVAGDNTAYSYRWRLSDIGGTPGRWTNGEIDADSVERPSPSFWLVSITGLPAGPLEFQLQAHQHDFSGWSESVFVDTSLPSPGRPTEFDAVLSGADVDLSSIAPNSANMDHGRYYRAISGASFGTADDISTEVPAGPRAAITFTDLAPASSTYDYWVVAESAEAVASLPRGPVTVTVP